MEILCGRFLVVGFAAIAIVWLGRLFGLPQVAFLGKLLVTSKYIVFRVDWSTW